MHKGSDRAHNATHCDQKVVGSNPPGCWAFFAFYFSISIFTYPGHWGRRNTLDISIKRLLARTAWDKPSLMSLVQTRISPDSFLMWSASRGSDLSATFTAWLRMLRTDFSPTPPWNKKSFGKRLSGAHFYLSTCANPSEKNMVWGV